VVWSSADLAVIFLDLPVKNFPALKLAKTEVQVGDAIVMVGYGPGETFQIHGERHFGENRVSWLRELESGSVEIVAAMQQLPDGRAASHIDVGDSGGGCFVRTANGDSVLVGISGGNAKSVRGESLSVFTSIYSHRDWLSQQLDEF
jgi:hypothetical protein